MPLLLLIQTSANGFLYDLFSPAVARWLVMHVILAVAIQTSVSAIIFLIHFTDIRTIFITVTKAFLTY